MTLVQGNPYTFAYNLRSELIATDYPGGYSRGLTYDLDGRLAADTIRNTGGTLYPRLGSDPVRATTFAYDRPAA